MSKLLKEELRKAAEKAASEVEDISIDTLMELFIDGAQWMITSQGSFEWTPVDPYNLPTKKSIGCKFSRIFRRT